METINHEYYSLEIAKLLKKTGFNWEVKTYYHYLSPYNEYNLEFDSISTNYNHLNNADFSAPSLDVAQRWLREVNKFHIDIQIMDIDNIKYGFIIHEIYEEKNPDIPFNNGVLHFVPFGLIYKGKSDKLFNTYEDAQEAGEKKALEIILKVKNEK